ncbi:hypothetical protein ABPG77_007262 [Micractinium sp. CCAP 211/92]
MAATAASAPQPAHQPEPALAAPPAPATETTALRDMYGFLVKPEFRSLYQRFAPIYAAEEEERSARWAEYLEELEAVCGSLPGEDEAGMLRRLLSHLEDTRSAEGRSDSSAPAPAQAVALQQRLSSLVQAGLPMAKRGTFWRLFLTVDAKRQEGEYARLVAEVQALEQRLHAVASPAGAAPSPLGTGKAAAAERSYQQQGLCASAAPGAVTLFADASSAAATAAGPAPPLAYPARISTFSVVPLHEEDSSPDATPIKPSSEASAAAVANAARLPLVTPAALTPASTLLTPLSDSSHESGGPGCAPPSAASQAAVAERWQQQDYLAQIDKDLHRTFPDHPSMDANGRATLRRILSAYARRNPAVGYCQGLNFLGATFLLFMSEEDAFWCLCALIEDILGASYFDERMVSVQVDVLVFGHLLQGRFPTLWAHLQELEVDAASVTMHWFLCAFLNSLPLDSTLRVWDQLFFEGSPVVLFRVALALVEIYDQALMCTRESSDVYMLLQGCAQMTFDGSRLVDTACCGYAYLQPAGLAALRQRYLQEVAQIAQAAFGTDDESSSEAASTDREPEHGGSPAAATFAHRFRCLNSALLDAEEAVIRQQQRHSGGRDTGHLSPASSKAGSSRSNSPGPGGGASHPASPVARVQQAMRGLTSRFMPSVLPPMLPAGAVGTGGQELAPIASSSTAFGRGAALAALRHASASPASASDSAASAEQKLAHVLRCISVGQPGGSSPTAGLSRSAGAGAALGRQPGNRLTPFSAVELDGLRQAGPFSLQQQQQQQQHVQERVNDSMATAGGSASTPQRLPSALVMPASAAPQSQPATPSNQHAPGWAPQPPHSQRRAWTAGYPGGTQPGHTRHRRRLTLDLLGLANLRLDLQQPAVAAAFAIAANPSPGGRGGAAGGSGGPSLEGSPADPAGGALSEALRPTSCDAELLLPVRTLHFDEQDGAAAAAEEAQEAPGRSRVRRLRRSITAPPEALVPSGDKGESICAPPEPGPEGAMAALAPAETPSPVASPSRVPQKLQASSLLAVVAQLQEEVAVAESRRHEAEQEAAALQQTAADLRQQLLKVERQVAAKEALVAELSSRLEASSAAITKLSGELSAKQLAVQAEEAAVERRRRELAAADALIVRLMDAVAQTQAHVGGSSGASTASTASTASRGTASQAVVDCGAMQSSSSSAQSSLAHSPQSSIGSVCQYRCVCTPQRNAGGL